MTSKTNKNHGDEENRKRKRRSESEEGAKSFEIVATNEAGKSTISQMTARTTTASTKTPSKTTEPSREKQIQATNVGEVYSSTAIISKGESIIFKWHNALDGDLLSQHFVVNPIVGLGGIKINVEEYKSDLDINLLTVKWLQGRALFAFTPHFRTVLPNLAAGFRPFLEIMFMAYKVGGKWKNFVLDDSSLDRAVGFIVSGKEWELWVGFDIIPTSEGSKESKQPKIVQKKNNIDQTPNPPNAVSSGIAFNVHWLPSWNGPSLKDYLKTHTLTGFEPGLKHVGIFHLHCATKDITMSRLGGGLLYAFSSQLDKLQDQNTRKRIRPQSLGLVYEDGTGAVERIHFSSAGNMARAMAIVEGSMDWHLEVGFELDAPVVDKTGGHSQVVIQR
ncbi:uncharacterized protein RSE6_05125 [Rhynchosporium secalis]|uniref:Uncharacterized protein n=1 Tax=Rhynchosporium secalis TaxID=38038 RepID=A0A1E1M6Z9_RHYSE|nr:uncharacterized protein RSE6_05125 [Rhynchosporium secalis]